jgi:hypothetical protein
VGLNLLPVGLDPLRNVLAEDLQVFDGIWLQRCKRVRGLIATEKLQRVSVELDLGKQPIPSLHLSKRCGSRITIRTVAVQVGLQDHVSPF